MLVLNWHDLNRQLDGKDRQFPKAGKERMIKQE